MYTISNFQTYFGKNRKLSIDRNLELFPKDLILMIEQYDLNIILEEKKMTQGGYPYVYYKNKIHYIFTKSNSAHFIDLEGNTSHILPLHLDPHLPLEQFIHDGWQIFFRSLSRSLYRIF